MSKRLITMAVLIVVIASAGMLLWQFPLGGYMLGAVLGATVFAVAMTTFFGILILSESLGEKWSLTKGGFRTALAGAVVVTYLFLVSFYMFVPYTGQLSKMTELLLDSFTGLVGVTIAFYFGAEAVIQAFGKAESSEQESSANKGKEK